MRRNNLYSNTFFCVNENTIRLLAVNYTNSSILLVLSIATPCHHTVALVRIKWKHPHHVFVSKLFLHLLKLKNSNDSLIILATFLPPKWFRSRQDRLSIYRPLGIQEKYCGQHYVPVTYYYSWISS